MESARRILQVIRAAMLVSIGFYVAISVAIPSTATPNLIILRAVSDWELRSKVSPQIWPHKSRCSPALQHELLAESFLRTPCANCPRFSPLALSNQIRRATNGNSAPHLVSMPAQPRPQPQEHVERHGAISVDRIKHVRLGIEHDVRSQPKLPMMVLHEITHSAESVCADAKRGMRGSLRKQLIFIHQL